MSSLLTVLVQAAAPDTSGDNSLSQILLYVGGFAGIASAIVAILKLKPDANSQSVTQAQGAATEWSKLAEEYDDKRKEVAVESRAWRIRALYLEALLRANGITIPDESPPAPPIV